MNARRPFLPVGFLVASLSMLACGAPPESGSESHTSTSSSSDSTSSSSDSTNGRACTSTLASYCATTSCLADWTSADAVCMSVQPGAPGAASIQMSAACGAFYALAQAATTSYFAASSGSLVAVLDTSGNCLGGPSDFEAPAAASCGLAPCGMENCGLPPSVGTK